jgi:hypothetical protein
MWAMMQKLRVLLDMKFPRKKGAEYGRALQARQ